MQKKKSEEKINKEKKKNVKKKLTKQERKEKREKKNQELEFVIEKSFKIKIFVVCFVIVFLGFVSLKSISIYNNFIFKKEKLESYKENILIYLDKRLEYLEVLNKDISVLDEQQPQLYETLETDISKIRDKESFQDKMYLNNQLSTNTKQVLNNGLKNSFLLKDETYVEHFNSFLNVDEKIKITLDEYNLIVQEYDENFEKFPNNIIAKMFFFEKYSEYNFENISIEKLDLNLDTENSTHVFEQDTSATID